MDLETGFQGIRVGNMPLQSVKLPISHNNLVGENTVLQLTILETGVLTLVVQNSYLRLVGDEYQSPKCFGGEPTISPVHMREIKVLLQVICQGRFLVEKQNLPAVKELADDNCNC